jgi:hypothetical protein
MPSFLFLFSPPNMLRIIMSVINLWVKLELYQQQTDVTHATPNFPGFVKEERRRGEWLLLQVQ